MKPEHYYLASATQKFHAIQRINGITSGDKLKVTISDAKGKSTQQRALQWLWNTEVADSGFGSYDTKEDVHRAAKFRWAVPLLLRDFPESNFSLIWPELLNLYSSDKDKIKYIVDEFVSTEKDGFAMSEYLRDFERFYRGNGINLTMPDDGLLDYLEQAA